MKMTLGWLVVAAALTMGFSACSSEESVIEEKPTPQQPAQATKIHVTVDAGIDNDDAATTRSLVVKDGTTRTLTFTAPVGNPGDANYSPGDRLYISGDIERNVRTMGGMLTVKNISDDGQSATFEGDLTVWKCEGWPYPEDTEWAATQTGDPMTWYGTNHIAATLVPAAATIGETYTMGGDGDINLNYGLSFVTGDGDLVKKLMESTFYVHGYYDKTDKCFNLECEDPIFNCTISGLKADQEYHVRFVNADNKEFYDNNDIQITWSYDVSVTTDGDGIARFACTIPFRGEGYWVIDFSTGSNFEDNTTHRYIIGERGEMWGNKVYNLTKAAKILCPSCHSTNVTTDGWGQYVCGDCSHSWYYW